jgi:hypothetical protein
MTRRSPRLRGWLLRWHRRIGLGVVVLVLIVTVTGLLIQFAHSFGWDRTPVRAGWLKSLYGVETAPVHEGFRIGGDWYARVGDAFYRNETPLSDCDGTLMAVFYQGEELLVLCGASLSVLDAQGALLEVVPSPVTPLRGGVSAGALAISDGKDTWRWSTDLAGWEPANGEVEWRLPEPLPMPLAKQLSQQVPLPDMTVERVLLDLHAGRLFGAVGEWLVNLAGLGLL